MKQGKETVFIALSGGVDSMATAALLLERGYHCEGVFMITCDHFVANRADAEKAAMALGIKLHVIDFRQEFKSILDYFFSQYKAGRTPNPCVYCNRLIKFGKLWEFAREHGAKFLSTGHYARVIKADSGVGLYEATNKAKDQSYVFSMANREALEHLILPMGEYTKDKAKEIAGSFDTGIEHKEESQEICFVPEDDYIRLIEHNCPELIKEGDIVDSGGKILGKHQGVHRFTIGQRRGLKVAMGVPYYVTCIDAENNRVTLGPKDEVMHNKLSASGVNWLIDEPTDVFTAKVKIRYNSRGAIAKVYPKNDRVEIEFDEAVLAITAGQTAVIYIEDEYGWRVAGGGWIDSAEDI